MATNTEATDPKPIPAPPKLVGMIGLALSLAGLVACVVVFFYGLPKVARGPLVLYGLTFAPVAGLGIWLFRDLLRMPDWTVAPEVPLGVKLLGNLGRVLGTLCAAACVALVIVTIVYPQWVPPLPIPKEGGQIPKAPRPGLAAVYFLGIFGFLLVRLVASAMAEVRRWARLGSLLLTGAALAGFTVSLILNSMRWKVDVAKLPLWVLAATSALLFVFLLGYLMLPECNRAFESQKL
jgi:hypothetical protein